MLKQKFCQHSKQSHDCQQLYQQLCETKGPSVVFKVVVAFLLPLMVFIVTLAVFEVILAKLHLQTALSFLLALSAALVCILITKAINTQLSKNK